MQHAAPHDFTPQVVASLGRASILRSLYQQADIGAAFRAGDSCL